MNHMPLILKNQCTNKPFYTLVFFIFISRQLLTPTIAYAQYFEQGRLGDPESWRSEEFNKDWGLAKMQADYAYALGFTGKGVKVGVMDGGFYKDHPEFSKRYYSVLAQGEYINGEPFSVEGFSHERNTSHGTHVSGTVGAARDGAGMHGVAFGAEVHVANHNAVPPDKPDDPNYFHAVYNGLATAGVRMVNSSWKSVPRGTSTKSLEDIKSTYSQYYNMHPWLAWLQAPVGTARNGVINIYSTGNVGSRFANMNTTLPYFEPELESYWIAVTSLTMDMKQIYNQCGVAKYWCIAAPGQKIYSAIIPNDGNFYDNKSGTSMAAPHATGALAIIMERFPYMSNDQAVQVLLTTATQTSDTPQILSDTPNTTIGWGAVNLRNAMAGPGQLLGRFEAHLPSGITDTWSHNISEKSLQARQLEDIEEQAAWLRTLEEKGWQNGLGETATDRERADYAVGTARARAAAQRATHGSLLKSGPGTLILTGDNTYRGDTTVKEGRLQVQGSLSSDVTLESGGSLGGTGSLQSLLANAGASVHPGNSVGTLTVSQDLTFKPGSVYAVEVTPDGRSDRLEVLGKAHLQGGTVSVALENSPHLLNQKEVQSVANKQFRILNAQKGIEGQFDSVLPNTLFIGSSLYYANDHLSLTVKRNASSFASFGHTANQRQSAQAVESLGYGNPLYESVLRAQTPADAQQVYQQLSGEIYPAITRTLLLHGRSLHQTLTARTRTPHTSNGPAWVQVHGTQSTSRSDGAAQAVRSKSQGLMVGVDHAINAKWRLGITAGQQQMAVNMASLQSKAKLTNAQLGGYATYQNGPFVGLLGASYGLHRAQVQRHVSYGGSSDTLNTQLRGQTAQAFVDVGYRMTNATGQTHEDAQNLAHSYFEPFVNLEYARVQQSAFKENGAAPALRGHQNSNVARSSTLGLRAQLQFTRPQSVAQEQTTEQFEAPVYSLHGMVGWQSYFNPTQPSSKLSFAAGSVPFHVASLPLGRNAAVLESGVGIQVNSQLTVSLNYSGLLARQHKEHAVKAQLLWQF